MKRFCRTCGQQIKGRKGGIGKCEKCLKKDTDFGEYLKERLKDPKFKKEYDKVKVAEKT